MLGWDRKVLGRMNRADFTHPEDRVRARALRDDVLLGKRERYRTQERYITQGGQTLWVDASVSVLCNATGNITHLVCVTHDITEQKQAEEKIRELVFYDQLTSLPNRTLLTDRLRQNMRISRRSGRYGALLFIDLDNFKSLNDTLGHGIGDLLLRQVAQRLALCVREGDTVANLGGDDFVVVLPSLSEDQAGAANTTEAVAQKILTALGQGFSLEEASYQCTASIGVTVFLGQTVTVDELMKQADLAMYKAKGSGRNVVRFFDPSMEFDVKMRLSLEDDLRQAIREQQFVLHYQAQVTHDDRVVGAEALLRWQHPKRGMVSPAEFIPLAEETGLILPLGQWVLQTACSQLVKWANDADMAQMVIAVNVSVQQFEDAEFVPQLLALLDSSGINPERLKLELTESVMVGKVQEIIDKMVALRARHLQFSLDDFGTGYSSLSYLRRLPLDQLKIDQSFVHDVLTNANEAMIAKAVVALAKGLNLDVVAEGVETTAQRDFLARSGCHTYQGYLFSRPVPVQEFEHLVRRVALARTVGLGGVADLTWCGLNHEKSAHSLKTLLH
ncbi:MAG: diguanylate cyclase/phosphodiesterase with PAS/PAC sensor(s) [Comamonadaceae bacterium]|nr:MAG: diguanylate cyclase/phosphodiesterase with PAS/PAC sensor(s) [Comamonadaceae bacterium]